jgi:hypothetical protein
MAVSRALRRLLRVRELEEEQSRLAVESATGKLHRLEQALSATGERDRRGRRLVEASAYTGELRDRIAGLEETRASARMVAVLVPRIESSEYEVSRLREEFLSKRVERLQAETLIKETEARGAIESGRHAQQGLDDWFRSKQHRARTEGSADERALFKPVSEELEVATKET